MKKRVNFILKFVLLFGVVVFSFSLLSKNIIADEFFPDKFIYEHNGVIMTEEQFNNTITADEPISILIEFNYEKFDKQISDYQYNTIEESNIVLSTHRAELKEYCSTNNADIVERLNNRLLEDFYLGQYSNFAQHAFENEEEYLDNINNLQLLAISEDIRKIYISQNEIEIGPNIDNEILWDLDSVEKYEFQDALRDIGLGSDRQYTGRNINVCIYELGILDLSFPDFSGREIIYSRRNDYDFNEQYHQDHATIVSSIAIGNYGVAPEANIFAKGTDRKDDKYLMELEWIVSHNVDVVNISFRMGTAIYQHYTGYDALIDYYSHSCGIVFVTAAGNFATPDSNNGTVIPPANAYNAITVGSIDVNKNVAPSSSYFQVYGKPNLVAPGQNLEIPTDPHYPIPGIYSGTSLAAPMVTGIVALLMEEFPSLRGRPDIILSTLMVSAEKLPNQNYGYDTKAGAGLVNYENARKIIKQGINTFVIDESYNNNNTVFEKNILLPEGATIRIAEATIFNQTLPSSVTSDPYPEDYLPFILEFIVYDGPEVFPLNFGNTYFVEYTNNSGISQSCKIKFYIHPFIRIDPGFILYGNIVYSINYDIKNEFEIHCRSEIIENNENYNPGETIIYSLNVLCDNNISIYVHSPYIETIEIYDESINKIDANVFDYGDWASANSYLQKGKYYILIKVQDSCDNGSFLVRFRCRSSGTPQITIGETINVATHLHDGENIFMYIPSRSDIYEFSIDIEKNNPFRYQSGIIKILNRDYNVIDKISINDFQSKAINGEDSNKLIVYLEAGQTYYIHINYPYDDYINFYLYSTRINESINLDNDYYFNNSDLGEGDNFKKIVLKQVGEYNINFTCTNINNKVVFAIFKVINNQVSIRNYKIITKADTSEVIRLITGQDEYYYIGYFTNSNTGVASLEITRNVTGDFDLIPDALWAHDNILGTEVTMNNGKREGTTITLGYTRCMFLADNAPGNSRLDFHWYSSNENILKVTPYGTVTATGVGVATIQAVYKKDNTIIGSVTFTVLPDNSTDEQVVRLTTDIREEPNPSGTEVTSGLGEPRGTTIHVGYTRFICFDNQFEGGSGSPTNIIQDYIWTSSDNSIATISEFGTIKGIKKGSVTITGVYKYNPKFVGQIVITII